jgi:predicted PurR-regulated permease PerM
MSDDRAALKRALTITAVIAGAALAVFLVVRLKTYVVIAFSAWILATVLDLPVRALQRRGMPRALAVVLTLVLVLALLGGVVALILIPAADQIGALLQLLPEGLRLGIEGYTELYSRYALLHQLLPSPSLLPTITPDGLILAPQADGTPAPPADLQAVIGPAWSVLTNVGTFVGSTFAAFILVMFITVLLLIEPLVYYRALVALVPRPAEARAVEILNLVRRNVERWSGALLISVTLTTLLYFIVLGVILRLPNAIALSVIAGVATLVPTIGNTLALIPVIIVAGLQGVPKLIAAVVLYALVGMVQDRVITPAIIRSELNIPAGLQILFQLALAVFIGPVGLLLAIPLLAMIITLGRELVVFDGLGKRGLLPDLQVSRDGSLTLTPEAASAPESAAPAVSPAADPPGPSDSAGPSGSAEPSGSTEPAGSA